MIALRNGFHMSITAGSMVAPCSFSMASRNNCKSSSVLPSPPARAVAFRYPLSAASITIMDLSVECEAFGGAIRFVESEVPTTIGSVVNDRSAVDSLRMPEVDAGRTGEYLHAAENLAEFITDRPVFGCHIGPFSLAARLLGMTEIM